jgi:hypothetical protein
LIGFVAEDIETIHDALSSTAYQSLEDKLLGYITNYKRSIVPFREGFQFTESAPTNGGR